LPFAVSQKSSICEKYCKNIEIHENAFAFNTESYIFLNTLSTQFRACVDLAYTAAHKKCVKFPRMVRLTCHNLKFCILYGNLEISDIGHFVRIQRFSLHIAGI